MCRRGVYFGHVDSVSILVDKRSSSWRFSLEKKRRLGPNTKNNTISLGKSVLTVEAVEATCIEATCLPEITPGPCNRVSAGPRPLSSGRDEAVSSRLAALSPRRC